MGGGSYDDYSTILRDVRDFYTKHRAGVILAATIATAYRSFEIVPPQSFGVRVSLGQMKEELLKPGFYFKSPILDNIDSFSNNTVIVESKLGDPQNKDGSDRAISADRNQVTALVRTHYRIDPKVGSLALKLTDIQDDNGREAFQKLERQSFSAVVGARSAADTMADPAGFLRAFNDNLSWRLVQNNMPIKVDTVELLAFDANIKKPTQLRIKSDGKVEQMAGPAAIDVQLGGKIVHPSETEVVPSRPGDKTVTRTINPSGDSIRSAP